LDDRQHRVMNWKTVLIAGAILFSSSSPAVATTQEIDILWVLNNSMCSWGLASGPDDYVYCTNPSIPGVIKFDAFGSNLNSRGSSGQGGGEFADPRGIAVDSQGRVYVVDSQYSRIQQFSADGVFEKMWGNDVLSGSGSEGNFEVCVAGETCYMGQTSSEGFTYPHDVSIDLSLKIDCPIGIFSRRRPSGTIRTFSAECCQWRPTGVTLILC